LPVVRRWPASLLVLLACLVAWPGLAPAQESGNRDSSKNLVSELRAIEPDVPGLELEVIERDRFLRLRNETGKQILVEGYDDEPYLRFATNGRVEVNTRSPSKYVNEDRFGRRPVPEQADSSATPRWEPVSSDGSYQWFDHRIHYMAPGTPEEVTDEAKRTKIFDWSVPMAVGGRPVRALGTLMWEPDEESDSSVVPIIAAGVGLAALVAGLGLFLGRRRRKPAPAAAAKPTKEAW